MLEEGQLVYCSHCGAPQIFLSEDLREQIRARARHTPGASHGDIFDEQDGGRPRSAETLETVAAERNGPASNGWPLAIRYALLGGGVALGLDLGALLFAPLLLVAWLWLVSAPILIVGWYSGRARRRPAPAFAARLGTLTGLLGVLGVAMALTLSLVLTRFAFHGGPGFDAQFAATLAQAASNATTRYGAPVEPTLHLLAVPEFRVGFLLWIAAIVTAGYLLLSALSAALAALLLGRRRLV